MSCELYIAPSLVLRFLLFSSHAAITLIGENETLLPCLYSFSSSFFFYPFIIRLGTYLSSLFSSFSLFSTCIAGVFLMCICKKRKKEVFNAAADDNNNNNDSHSRLVVIFFIPELLLAKSC